MSLVAFRPWPRKKRMVSKIRSLAEQAAREVLENMPALKDTGLSERGVLIKQALCAGQGGPARLMTAVQDNSSFGDLRGGWIQLGNHGMQVEPETILGFLISSAIDGHPVKPAIDEMRAFADFRTSLVEFYSPLGGFTVAEAVSLDRDIDLIPWADVPDCIQKTMFSGHLAQGPFLRVRATSAVRSRLGERQVLFPEHSAKKSIDEGRHWESAEQVVRCLTALGVWNVAALGQWSYSSRQLVNGIAVAGCGYNSAVFDTNVAVASISPKVVDRDSIEQTFQRLKAFKPSDMAVVGHSLDRLGQAVRREKHVDMAIDLGIALELILLHGTSQQTELRYALGGGRSSVLGR